MSKVGAVEWVDLTVEDAGPMREFYEDVVGWKSEGLDCGGYDDFCMQLPESGQTVAGVCHKKGVNEKLPPYWMVYFSVEDLERSMKAIQARGGEIVDGPRSMGGGQGCFFRDPAGAYAAIVEPA